MNKKRFIFLLVGIFLVVVAAIVGVHFLLGSKDNKEPDKKDKDEKVVTYEVTDPKILDTLKIFDGPGCDTVIETFCNDHTVYAKDIPSGIVIATPWHKGDLGEQTKISLADYSKLVQKYYGKDYQLEPKKEDGLLCIWSYNESEKAYVKNPNPACGCIGDPAYTRYRVVKAVQTGDELVIELRVAFYRTSGDCFYEDYEATRSISTNEMKIDGMDFYDSDAAYSKASLYKLTFKEIDNNYVFLSSERA